MISLQIAIIDDCQRDRDLVRDMTARYLQEHQIQGDIQCFPSSESFLRDSHPEQFSILLLDLYMDGMDGMSLAQIIRQQGIPSQLVFVTSSDAYAVRSYDVEASDYLLKPVSAPALERALGVLGAQVKAAAAADGKVSLYGYVKDPYVEAELLSAVQPYFADLVLQPHFKYFEEALPLLQEQSRKLQLPLEWGSADTALIYSGRLTFAERGRMEKLRTAVSTALGVPLKFLSADDARQVLIARINDPKAVAALMQSAAGVPEAAAPTADSAAPAESTGAFRVQDVIGVTMQPLRFITLKSGQKFFEGAVLPGGAVLQQISLDRLVLNQHGREVSYELN